MTFKKLQKLTKGDKVAILSPSLAAPGIWPHVYELGVKRLRDIFDLEPVEFPTTKQVGASTEERTKDIIAAFKDKRIKAIITSLGGGDQIVYIKNIPREVLMSNPKPVFGFSDNTNLANHLWLSGVPSYYGGALFTQFAMHGEMDEFTIKYLKHALFDSGEFELTSSPEFTDMSLNWDEPENLMKKREYEKNEGWIWDGDTDAEGITWGGCVESFDELLRHGVEIPSLKDFESIVLIAETSEEIPKATYVMRVFRALGERGILSRIYAVLIGRPKTWSFEKPFDNEKRMKIKKNHQKVIFETVRRYNSTIPIIQNMDFGHTDPQICMPYGRSIRILSSKKKIFASF